MSIVILDGPALEEFVNDSEAFSRCVDDHFKMLDADGDGVLSRGELRNRGGKVSRECELQSQEEIKSLYDALFDKFDTNRNGKIDRDQFRALTREIMSAKAQGIGNSPVSIIVQGDSLANSTLGFLTKVSRVSQINAFWISKTHSIHC